MWIHDSRWGFPLPINQTFKNDFYNQQPSGSAQDLIISTVHNLTLVDRSDPFIGPDPKFFKDKLGKEDIPVLLGDTFSLSFSRESRDSREMSKKNKAQLECVMCIEGAKMEGIFSACSNYTDTENLVSISTSYPLIYENEYNGPHNVTIQSLSETENIPSSACGLCTLTLCLGEDCGIENIKDHTAPVPIINENRAQSWIFSYEHPIGTELSSVSSPSPSPTVFNFGLAHYTDTPKPENKAKVIVPIVVVILAFLFGAAFWQWKRKNNMKKHSPEYAEEGIQNSRQDNWPVGFASTSRPPHVPKVYLRPTNNDAPPSYWEAMRIGRYGVTST